MAFLDRNGHCKMGLEPAVSIALIGLDVNLNLLLTLLFVILCSRLLGRDSCLTAKMLIHALPFGDSTRLTNTFIGLPPNLYMSETKAGQRRLEMAKALWATIGIILPTAGNLGVMLIGRDVNLGETRERAKPESYSLPTGCLLFFYGHRIGNCLGQAYMRLEIPFRLGERCRGFFKESERFLANVMQSVQQEVMQMAGDTIRTSLRRSGSTKIRDQALKYGRPNEETPAKWSAEYEDFNAPAETGMAMKKMKSDGMEKKMKSEGKLDKYGRPNEETPAKWNAEYKDFNAPAETVTTANSNTKLEIPPAPTIKADAEAEY
ncbi:MAG: hypothetical protein Q9222_002199 [Ikaeria aurantiellina]